MELTEEQREKIRKNREKALEIRKRRRKDEQLSQESTGRANSSDSANRTKVSSGVEESKRQKFEPSKKAADEEKGRDNWVDGKEEELEEFEVGASTFVTKKEAMKMYCLPEGTLAVCDVVHEKQNPRQRGWAPMKLYDRAEIRRRARKRHGGMEGLISERAKREERRFQKDLERTKDVFR